MTDSATRALDPLSAAEIRARMRTGELAWWQVALAADAGCPGAMAIMPAPGQPLEGWAARDVAMCRGMPRIPEPGDYARVVECWRATNRTVIRWALQLGDDAGEEAGL